MTQLIILGLTLALAGIGPTIFPIALSGHGSLPILATRLLFPAILGLIVLTRVKPAQWPWLARDILGGAAAGAVATIALEVIRLTGYSLGFMPGNLPRLMGVLLLDRFALGPSLASDLAGWAYHFWNGASFGIVYVILVGTHRRWLGGVFGLLVGLGFMMSPVVQSLGVGFFGLEFSLGFPLTVLLAHLGFGLALGYLGRLTTGSHPGRLLPALLTPILALRSQAPVR